MHDKIFLKKEQQQSKGHALAERRKQLQEGQEAFGKTMTRKYSSLTLFHSCSVGEFGRQEREDTDEGSRLNSHRNIFQILDFRPSQSFFNARAEKQQLQ